MAFCPECGTEISAEAMSCPKCGKPLNSGTIQKVLHKGKKKSTAALFAFFLGGLGVHRFYLGENSKGIVRICIQIFAIILSMVSVTVGVPILDFTATFLIIANSLWALYDFATLMRMSATAFDEKYNS